MVTIVPLLWIVLGVAVCLYSIYGIVLAYHWVQWGQSMAASTLAITLYAAIGCVLTAIMLGSVLALSI